MVWVAIQGNSKINYSDPLVVGAMIDGLKECFVHLPEREQFVLKHRFGLEGRPVRTLKNIAEEMGISKRVGLR